MRSQELIKSLHDKSYIFGLKQKIGCDYIVGHYNNEYCIFPKKKLI